MKFSSQAVVAGVVWFLTTTASISISASPMQVKVQKDPIKIENDPDELNPDVIQYIVGGDPSENGLYPYYIKLNQANWFCGGSLIAPRVVLTAAHCQPQGNIGDSITVGPTNRYSLDNGDFQPARIIRTVDAVPHPNYYSAFVGNDFALVLLEEEYVLDSNGVQLVLNDESSFPPAGDVLDVLGMGTLASNGNHPNVLMDVQVKSFSNSQCSSILDFGSIPITENMICAGVEEGGKDSCQGDSGGPLVKVNGNTHTQVGVVSWGYGCAYANSPSVYARVSEQIDWMRDQICDKWEVESYLCGPCKDNSKVVFKVPNKKGSTKKKKCSKIKEKDCDTKYDFKKKVNGVKKGKPKDFCQETCNPKECCKDGTDTDYKIKTKKGKKVKGTFSCKKIKKKDYCKGTLQTGEKLKEVCKNSCDGC